ncbi:unnamed protein product [Candidula unifasciata]|uniref:RNA helicase n=1 Tax=Candidula unifasciata TaxID=100452 RepID=A0A8S3ZWP6_9EUPU|nr:unnamed protein product [Candidula unifasciata]
MPRRHLDKNERGPKLNEPVCIGEDVKIGIHLAIERFRLDATQQELCFPSSLSTTERAYIHRYCNQLSDLKARSRGHGQNRCISVRKIEGGRKGTTLPSLFSLAHNASQVNAVLSKYPVTAKEKQDLTPQLVKSANANESRDKSNFGRLTNVVPQIPAKRGTSELGKFREMLPVFQMGNKIMDVINANRVVLIAGETGSGKTTQVPQLILDDCSEKKEACRMLCPQPRRIAAVSIAERVAAERGERLGHTVGYQIRLESKISQKTVLTFCTTGVLLRTLMGGDACLSSVTHIIVDEVHERDRFTDFLLLCLKEALPHHQNLRVILMSATLNTDLFSEYFNCCPIVSVSGNMFPVEEYFLEDILKWTAYKNKAMDKALLTTQKSKVQEECLSEWCSKQLNIAESAIGSGTEEDSDVTTSDNAELGEEKEELEPWVIEEMDRLLREVWLTGSEELFHQILYLISSENVSVDYVQSETSTTPLMIAAARGFINVVEHLLNLGADAGLRTSNNWTALDLAKKFQRNDILELLEAHLASLDLAHNTVSEDLQLVSEEDRELLSVYQHSFDDEKVDINLVTCLIHQIHTGEREGAILVFLPGYDEIMNLKVAITEDVRFQQSRFVIYTLHSSLQYTDQKKVFKPSPQGIRKIILSTNIAETSITINDVVFVIDCGKVKEKTYDALTSLTMLKSNWISKASALQRKGRAGRCQSGKCYHLFSRSRYMHLQDYQTPEILRLPLHELCLHTKLLAPNSQSVETFLSKCPQAPPQLVIRNAIQNLKKIDALDTFEDMTELGQHLADLPIEPRLGKIILYSVVLKCLDPVLTIVSTLSYKEPFIIPALPSERRSVMGKRKKFAEDTYSDHMAFLRAFQSWQKARAEGWERAFCEKNFISSSTMEMIHGIRMQVLAQLRASGFLRAKGAGDIRDLNTNSDNWALVKACLVAGTYPNIIQRDRTNCLCTTTEKRVRFHTSSVLQPATSVTSVLPANSMKKFVKTLPSKWLIYEEMSRSQRVSLAKYCTLVSPAAMFLFAGHSKVTTDAIKQSEDPEDGGDRHAGNVTVKLDEWISFVFESVTNAKTAVLFRMKWHSLFLNRMRHPNRPWTQAEEAVLQAICAVLTNAEKTMGFENPVGIGQQPRVFEPTGFDDYYNRPGSTTGYQHPYYHQQQQQQHLNQQHIQQQQQQMYRGHGSAAGRGYSSQHQKNFQSYTKSQPINSGAKEDSRGSALNNSSHVASPAPPAATTMAGNKTTSQTIEDGRYFLMRCHNQKIIDMSEAKGIWACSFANEAKLDRAFHSGKNVFLIFCVPGNGNFQGYARMTSPVTRNRAPVFPGSGFTVVFDIEWIKRAILPFSMTNSLLNSWNENRKIHSGRDGQEIETKVAVELMRMWDTQQLRCPQTGGKKKAGGQQTLKPTFPQKQPQKTEKRRSENTPSSDDRSDKERGEVSQSSPSPALSTNTNNSSGDSTSRTSSPAHKPQAEGGGGQLQGISGSSQPGLIMQSPAQLMPQGFAAGNANKSYYSNTYQQQQQQQGVFGKPTLSVANNAPGLNPLLMAQAGLIGQGLTVGPQAGLSPVMILHRGHPSPAPQTPQPHYFSGGQYNHHK